MAKAAKTCYVAGAKVGECGVSACGRRWGTVGTNSPASGNPSHVTCGSCKRTHLFRSALTRRERESRDANLRADAERARAARAAEREGAQR